MNSASLCSLAGRYENLIPPWCLAPIDFLKIPAQLYNGIYLGYHKVDGGGGEGGDPFPDILLCDSKGYLSCLYKSYLSNSLVYPCTHGIATEYKEENP